MTLSEWSDVAIVVLCIEAIVLALVPGFIFFMSIRGTEWMIKQTRFYAPLVQARFRDVAGSTEKASQRIASPLISTRAGNARMRGWVTGAFRSQGSRKWR